MNEWKRIIEQAKTHKRVQPKKEKKKKKKKKKRNTSVSQLLNVDVPFL
jgi:hypothetical protein